MNCEICGENTCLKCRDSYYYNNILKECKRKNPDDIKCADHNCKYCYTEEDDTCYECKQGYYLNYGKCSAATAVNIYGWCPNNNYYIYNGYCYLKCDGLQCNFKKNYNYYSCLSNDCLYCQNNILKIINFCENKQLCNIEGCMVCKTSSECMKCSPGYFNKNGQCIKCINGCLVCTSTNTCDYCLSGYKLDNNKKCIKINDLDFNITLYNSQKQYLIKNNYPIEYNSNSQTDIEMDQNCNKYYDSTGECFGCYFPYTFQDNKCKEICSDPNCLSCKFRNFYEECLQCKNDYYIKNGRCIYSLDCLDNNCEECRDQFQYSCLKYKKRKILMNGQYLDYSSNKCLICEDNICYKCSNNPISNKNKTKKGTNYIFLVYIFLGIALLIGTIILVVYCYKKRRQNNNNVVNINQRNDAHVPYDNPYHESGRRINNNVQARANNNHVRNNNNHNQRNDRNNFGREFDDLLRQNIANSRTQSIDFQCNICLENNINLAHFRCGCTFRVCRNCYIRQKTNSNICPQCRRNI